MVYVPDADIDRLIAEDSGFGDLTTTALGIGSEPGVMRFAARHAMVACATEEAARLLARLGARVELITRSGQAAEPGTPLLTATGPAATLHAGWKAAQTLIEWASGISTAVHTIADAARKRRPDIVIACTRKAVPLTRLLSIKAVHSGGGVMHRTGLSDTVLLFAEHRAFLPGLDPAALISRLRASAPERKLAVEVNDMETALAFAQAGADILQLGEIPAGFGGACCRGARFAAAPATDRCGGRCERDERRRLCRCWGGRAGHVRPYWPRHAMCK